jgi:hypothetical protein
VNITVAVIDTVGRPIAGARITVLGSSFVAPLITNTLGQAYLEQNSASWIRIKIEHPQYVEEALESLIPPSGGSFLWNNPVCSIAPEGVITVRLSCIQPAPLMPISKKDLLKAAPFNPGKAFVEVSESGNSTGRYLNINNGSLGFYPVKQRLLPSTPTEGWGRIEHSSMERIDPSSDGDLALLEWGVEEGAKTLLVAVWFPRYRGTTPTSVDFIIFFSPNTAFAEYPQTASAYPYQTDKKGSGGNLRQPFLSLAYRFLFHEKYLTYQLLAAHRQAVLIFPIQPPAGCGPFGEVSGLSRLVAEVTHFMHREGRTSGGITDRSQDLAPRRGYRFLRNGIHRPPPPLNRVILAGFSSGMNPVLDMLGAYHGQTLRALGFNPTIFGADPSKFLNAWSEVWDHDTPAEIRGKLDTNLPAWLNRTPERVARCYQTDYTGSLNWIKSTPLKNFVQEPLKFISGVASEQHSNKCSLVYFGSGYLHHVANDNSAQQKFWEDKDSHQAVPHITFGHAACLSGLRKSD